MKGESWNCNALDGLLGQIHSVALHVTFWRCFTDRNKQIRLLVDERWNR